MLLSVVNIVIKYTKIIDLMGKLILIMVISMMNISECFIIIWFDGFIIIHQLIEIWYILISTIIINSVKKPDFVQFEVLQCSFSEMMN